MYNSHRFRCGSILVCVLVVLLIVGMLSAQTVQMLIVVRQGDIQREKLRQARELVELGRLVLNQNPGTGPIGELTILVDASNGSTGSISLDPVRSSETRPPSQFRIVAKFPVGTDHEITATQMAATKLMTPQENGK